MTVKHHIARISIRRNHTVAVHHYRTALALFSVEIVREIVVVIFSFYNRIIDRRTVYFEVAYRIGIYFKQLLERGKYFLACTAVVSVGNIYVRYSLTSPLVTEHHKYVRNKRYSRGKKYDQCDYKHQFSDDRRHTVAFPRDNSLDKPFPKTRLFCSHTVTAWILFHVCCHLCSLYLT